MHQPFEPFRIAIPETQLDDLRLRLSRTRWPDPQPVSNWSQGMPQHVVMELCRSWQLDFDWRATERRLNRIPQFRTTIDGLPIHFLHVRSRDPDATAVVLTHGWPGSFLEFEAVIPILTAPPDGGPACHVVVPSLPGYGFSGHPTVTGWDIHGIARTWCDLMIRLGYDRFIAAGSDWGTSISTSIALQHPDLLLGLHLVPPLAPPDPSAPDLTATEQRLLADLEERTHTGSAYSDIHATRPQTIGYGLSDSPAGLAAWIGEKLYTWADQAAGGLTRGQILDNLSLYWLTNTAASSTRLYWESIAEVSKWITGPEPEKVTVPTGCSVFPKEVPRLSRRWAAHRFTNIVHWSEPAHGGHFAAWEQPELFSHDLVETIRAIRDS